MVWSWRWCVPTSDPGRHESARARVGLLGGVGAGNTGNEVSFDVVRTHLADADEDARFAIITPMPEGALSGVAGPDDLVIAMRAPHISGRGWSLAVVRHRCRAEARQVLSVVHAVGGLRGIVVCGTGILDDFEEPPWGMPWALFVWALVARARHCPFVLLAVGAGPVTGRVSGALFAATVRLASAVTYRDGASRRTMAAIGGGRKDARVTCDLAFGHPAPPWRAPEAGPSMRLGIGVMDWSGWKGADPAVHERYLQVLVETISGALERGHRAILLPGQPVDVCVAQEVRSRVLRGGRWAASAVEVAPSGTFDDLCSAIRSVDMVLAARFHTILAGVLCGRSVVSMGYAPKNSELLAALGLDGVDREIGTITSEWLLAHIDVVAAGGQGSLPDAEVVARWQALTQEELRRLEGWFPTPRARGGSCPRTTPRPWRPPRTRASSSPRAGSR